MRKKPPRTSFNQLPALLILPALALLLLLPAGVAVADPVLLDAPEDVEYWVCNQTGKRLRWGAVGIIIDEWDTRTEGFEDELLIWYRFRTLYPDGRTFETGYRFVLRDRPDPTIRVGNWAIHNWPLASPESLIPLDVVAVLRAPRPGDKQTDLAGLPVPRYEPRYTTVTVNTRWYPPPPRLELSLRAGESPLNFYADDRFESGLEQNPYRNSRYALATGAYVDDATDRDHAWQGQQRATLVEGRQTGRLQHEFSASSEREKPLVINHVRGLEDRLRGVERYTGSPVDVATRGVLGATDGIFAALLPEGVSADARAGRTIPRDIFRHMPTPDLETVQGEVAPADFTASLSGRMRPLVSELATRPVEDVLLLDTRLALWSGGQPALAPDGDFAGQAPQLVAGSLLEPVNEGDDINDIQLATAAFEELTGFVDQGADGTAEFDAEIKPVFSLRSNASIHIEAALQRDYRENPEPVNVFALLAPGEENPLQTLNTDNLKRTVNFSRITWRPLPDRFRELTGDPSSTALLPPPGLRGDARDVWLRFLDARSQEDR